MTDATDPRDEPTLRAAILRGEEAAWTVLYRRTFPALWGYAHVRCAGKRDLTEEVVQECWMVAVKRIRTFRPERGPFEAWIKGIAANLLRNRSRCRPEPEASEALNTAEAPAKAIASGPEEKVALVLTALPLVWQEVLRAKYQEGLAVGEIAGRTGRTVKSVESLLSRAREAFRTAWRSFDENQGGLGP